MAHASSALTLTAHEFCLVATMAGYNITRSVEELLQRHARSPPSFTIHLYPEHWTLNGGLKTLYNNHLAVRWPSSLSAAVLIAAVEVVPAR